VSHDMDIESTNSHLYHVLEDPALKNQQNLLSAAEEEEGHRTEVSVCNGYLFLGTINIVLLV